MTIKPVYFIDADTIHNWSTRYADLPYFKTLPMDIRLDIQHANKVHLKQGSKTASEWVDYLIAQYPGDLVK